MTFDEALQHYKTGRAIGKVLNLTDGRISQCKSEGGFAYPEQCVLQIDSKNKLVAKREDDPSFSKAA